MGRKAVVPAAVADALTAERPAANASRAVSVLAGERPDELANKDADTLAAEILALQIQGNRVLLAIGRRLIAAKDKLSHGDWLPWLESVNIPPRLAQRYMKLAREWSANASLLSDLGMTKALILLSLPEEAQEEFVAETHVVDGEEKSIADMTAKELADAIQARKQAEGLLDLREKQLKAAETRYNEKEQEFLALTNKFAESQTRLVMADEKLKAAIAEKNAEMEKRFAATDELFRLRDKPAEVVTDAAALEQAREEVRQQMQSDLDFARKNAETARKALDAAKADAKAALEKAKSDASTALDEANAAAKAAQSDAEAARKELERVKADAKAAPLKDNGLALFNVLFEQTQAAVNQMRGIILKTEDPERKEKLQNALYALAEKIGKKAEA